MPVENPDIIQIGGLIRTPDQLGSSSIYHSQTGLDIGDDTPADVKPAVIPATSPYYMPGAGGAGRSPPADDPSRQAPTASSKFKAFTKTPEFKLLVGGVVGITLGIILGRQMK